jgi:hypothetical protein
LLFTAQQLIVELLVVLVKRTATHYCSKAKSTATRFTRWQRYGKQQQVKAGYETHEAVFCASVLLVVLTTALSVAFCCSPQELHRYSVCCCLRAMLLYCYTGTAQLLHSSIGRSLQRSVFQNSTCLVTL